LTVSAARQLGEPRTRAGAQALSLLAAPVNVAILEALAKGPASLIDIRRTAGSPPQTTMRKSLQRLTEQGVLEKNRSDTFPGAIDFELTTSGSELLELAAVVSSWLAVSPEGPVTLGTAKAKSVVKALVDGWSTNILRALAARPFALTELDSLITSLSYPALERRLGAMHLVGQVEKHRAIGRGTPYAVTDWLRLGVVPLVVAMYWERQYLSPAPPITARDVEAAFLLALPLVRLPETLCGNCRLAVEVSAGGRIAGAMAQVRGGKVIRCTSRLQGDPVAWALGSSGAWLHAVIECDPTVLDLGGDCTLASTLIEHLSHAPFDVGAQRHPRLLVKRRFAGN
jgi:DNA-binding HxlR family transcriptional regulator